MQTNSKRIISIALTLLLAFNLIPALTFATFAAEEVVLSKWAFVQGDTATTATLPQKSTGVYAGYDFSHYSQTTVNYTASSSTIYIGNWQDADKEDKYWKAETSTKGYKDLALTFNAYGSGTSPKNFVLEYSTDGETYDPLYAYDLTASIATKEVDSTKLKALEDEETLFLRFRAVDTVSIGGGIVAAGGNSRMADVTLTGVAIGDIEKETLDVPTASPAPGTYETLPSVTLTAADGAAIYYTLDGTAPTTESSVYDGPIDLSELTSPVTVKAFAVKDGFIDSDAASFTYRLREVVTLSYWSFANGNLPQKSTGIYAGYDFSHYLKTKVFYGTENKTIYTNGWEDADTTDKYWLAETSTKGYKDLTLSFGAHGSNQSPRNFVLEYSTDGEAYNEVGAYTVSMGYNTKSFDSAQLKALEDAEKLFLRFRAADTEAIVSANFPAVTPNGDSRIAEVMLNGVSIDGSSYKEDLDPPTASPEPGDYETLPAVSLSAESGATIYYTLDGTTPTTGSSAYSAPIDLTGLTSPVTVKAFAVKDSFNDSTVATFVYTLKTEPSGEFFPDGESGTIAAWDITAAPGGTVTSIPATSGDAMSASNITATVKGTAKTFGTFSSQGVAISGWDNAANDGYWLVKTSTKGFTNIKFSFRMRSSGTGPKDFTIQYGTDGINWTDAKDIVVGNALALSYNESLFSVDLSGDAAAAAANKETLYFRILLTSNISAREYDNIQSGGTNTVNSFNVSGDYIVYENQVYPVTASKTGTAGLGEVITFSSATDGAIIMLSIDGGATYYKRNSITLGILPATIHAKAVKDGMLDSRVKVFTYTQAKLDLVGTDTPYGAVKAGTNVTLTSEEGATIYYTLTTGYGTDDAVTLPKTVFTGPIALLSDMFPVRIETYAEKFGYLDSDPLILDYTLKSSAGGEKSYYGQLHAHTTNSDGAGSLEEAFTYARDTAKLDFFAVTDHSNSFDTAPAGDKAGTYNLREYNAGNEAWQNGQNAAAAARRSDFVSVYGYEMTWSGGPGHMNTFNTQGFVSRLNTELNSKTNNAGLRAYYELLKATPESISQFNHPGKTFGNFANFAYYNPVTDSRISLIEIGNGEGTIGSGGYFPSYGEYNKALDRGWHLAPTNNQDNHKKGWGTSNTCRTVIWTNDLSVDGLYQAMRDMNVYATEVADLDITYTVNDEPLGTSFANIPTEANFSAVVKNPTAGNTVKSVSLITNGGIEIGKKTFNTQNANYEFTLEAPEPGYYYLRVVDTVGGKERYAVTAPVWFGKADAIGITEVTKNTALPVTTEELTLTTSLFNNESMSATLTEITYTDDKGNVLFTGTPYTTIAADGGEISHSMSYTPTEAGEVAVTVTATIMYDGKSKTYVSDLDYTVTDIDAVTYIGIDASHYNEYVSGNYKDSMTNFTALAATYSVRTVQYNTSEELIAACSNPKVKTMILTAPSRRLNPAGSKFYSDAEIAAVASFAKSGGTVIIAGWSDTYETSSGVPTGLENHMAGQQNKLLKAIGSFLRLGDDASVDEKLNPSPNQYRLYFKDTYNAENPLCAGIDPEQEYSVYGGSTVYVAGADGYPMTTLPNNISPIISGLPTTWSEDRDGDGYGIADKAYKLPRYGNSADVGRGAGVPLLNASETVWHGDGKSSLVIVSGGAFMSNFEIQIEMDNLGTLPYSNYTILSNIIKMAAPEVKITSIADAKALPEGTTVTIEGIATSSVNEGATPTNKGFFDCIYVQDETGGINVHPISEGVLEGQKVRVTGKVSSYQGEMQIGFTSKYEVVDPSINSVEPMPVSTYSSMIPNTTGLLIKTEGIVSDVIKEADGTVSQFILNDGTGPALVYINSYITPGTATGFIEPGAKVSVIGLASIGENYASDDMLPRIRVRDRAEIVLVEEKDIPATGVKIDGAAIQQVRIRGTKQFTATITPGDSTDTLTWKSSNEKIFTVDGNGLVTGVGTGNAQLIVITSSGKTVFIIVQVTA